jgi:carbon-monoxide dehydrogenase medium subunit
MIPQEFEYSSPSTLKEALGLLKSGEAKALAGGMSLVPLMKLRLATPAHVVDLGRIPGLNEIREEAGSIKIGAMATHYQIESSPVLRGRSPLLAEAAGHIGDLQVRNMGTIGGSIAHADPAADYPASLFALEANIRIVGASSDRTVAVGDFFQDTFTTAVEPGELVLEVIVPVEAAGTGTSYQKMVQPASGFAIVGVAARIRKDAGRVAMARIGVTGLSPKPNRATNVEKLLEGTAGSDADINKAAAVIADGVEANSDLHASADYRRHCAKVYAGRAIRAALSRIA